MIIRKVAEDDKPQWLALWAAYNAFYGREGPTALAPEITDATWHRFFDPAEPVHALVAEVDERVVGFAHFLFHRSTIFLSPVCYLQDLFTSEEARGRGVATALIEGASGVAAAAGSKRIDWQTHETNSRARMLYDRLADRSGFIIYRKALEPR
jgi:GNAT superfamily N-acetyltransferase